MRGLTLCHGAFEKKRQNKQAHHEGFKNQKRRRAFALRLNEN
jgi:hypothetical protein